uniref:Protein bunched, class 2/F/G isoform n=1 Tax=Cacopsylla melanoneura TaxID=428564 RepID=A0A8D8YC70_9HEMI
MADTQHSNNTIEENRSTDGETETGGGKSTFEITCIVNTRPSDVGEDSADDLDESHTEDISRVTDVDVENETPSYSEDTSYSKEDVFFNTSTALSTAPVIPTSSQYGLAIVPPDNPSGVLKTSELHVVPDTVLNLVGVKHSEVVENTHGPRNERFKVVKIESTEPFKRGRWVCMDYLDHSMPPQPPVVPNKSVDNLDNFSVNSQNQPGCDSNHSINDTGAVMYVDDRNNIISSEPPYNPSMMNSEQPQVITSNSNNISPGQTIQFTQPVTQVPQQQQHAQSLSQIPVQQLVSNNQQPQSLQPQQIQQVLNNYQVPMQVSPNQQQYQQNSNPQPQPIQHQPVSQNIQTVPQAQTILMTQSIPQQQQSMQTNPPSSQSSQQNLQPSPNTIHQSSPQPPPSSQSQPSTQQQQQQQQKFPQIQRSKSIKFVKNKFNNSGNSRPPMPGLNPIEKCPTVEIISSPEISLYNIPADSNGGNSKRMRMSPSLEITPDVSISKTFLPKMKSISSSIPISQSNLPPTSSTSVSITSSTPNTSQPNLVFLLPPVSLYGSGNSNQVTFSQSNMQGSFDPRRQNFINSRMPNTNTTRVSKAGTPMLISQVRSLAPSMQNNSNIRPRRNSNELRFPPILPTPTSGELLLAAFPTLVNNNITVRGPNPNPMQGTTPNQTPVSYSGPIPNHMIFPQVSSSPRASFTPQVLARSIAKNIRSLLKTRPDLQTNFHGNKGEP